MTVILLILLAIIFLIGTMNKTIHYKIILAYPDFNDNLEVLETNSKKKAIKRVLFI